ncbi:hypothetical protein DPMN_070369 [Dreissena polymorpha]|uniref:Uncharacterized protein n=1 Tax=Dreissena polymorpha TaxID=45954 RepID=A0A9D3Z0M7_DREPO|nr:hypothetical protein DPMN_070369 [Dreissena polymorpha]
MLMMLGSYCSPIIAGDRDRPVSRIADSERPSLAATMNGNTGTSMRQRSVRSPIHNKALGTFENIP